DSRAFIFLKMTHFDAAVSDYDAALRIDPKLAFALYGRGLARLKNGDPSGEADIAAAKALQADIAEEYARHGMQEPREPFVGAACRRAGRWAAISISKSRWPNSRPGWRSCARSRAATVQPPSARRFPASKPGQRRCSKISTRNSRLGKRPKSLAIRSVPIALTMSGPSSAISFRYPATASSATTSQSSAASAAFAA